MLFINIIFLECGYSVMIVNKVSGFSFIILPKELVHPVRDTVPIRIVSTQDADDFLESNLAKYEPFIGESPIVCSIKANFKMFNHVYRTAPKLESLLSSTKQFVIGKYSQRRCLFGLQTSIQANCS